MTDGNVRSLRHVLLCAVGSSGDVHPFVGLGRVLRQRGHRVTLFAAGYFRDLAEAAGLEFVNPLPELDYVEAIRNPKIWHPLRGPGTINEIVVKPLLEPLFRGVADHQTPGETIVVASSLALGARVAQEALGVPLVGVHLSPALFRSAWEGPRLPGLAVHRGPRWFKRLQWSLIDALVIDRAVCPWLNAFRSRHGLRPISGFHRDWMHAPLRVLAMFPDWYAPPQPDWPPQVRLTGFPLYSEEGVSLPSAELERFVAAGPPPLVFTPGSGNVFGAEFFRAAVDACRRLSRRGILLTRFGGQVPQSLPEDVVHAEFAPFGWLLAKSAVLVHHGGIGSLSQALAAGIPQVVMPMGFDQLDNAARIERLGVGRSLSPARFRGPALAVRIQELLADPAVADRCRVLAERLAPRDGLERACDEIEAAWRIHQSSPARVPRA